MAPLGDRKKCPKGYRRDPKDRTMCVSSKSHNKKTLKKRVVKKTYAKPKFKTFKVNQTVSVTVKGRTLGDQKKTNYALRENMTKDEFIREVLDGLLDPPKYFPDNVMLNKKGYDESDEIIERSFNALTPGQVESRLKEKITILDVRSVEDFSSSHIPGSIFIGLDGRFAPWVGEILEDISKKLILVAPEGREKEAIIRLSRVGFDNVIGYLKGGVNSWIKNGGIISKVFNESASKFSTCDNNKDILDVRSENEHKSESLQNSLNIPLINLSKSIEKISFEEKFYVHCKGGYRSMIASSILLAKGISNFSNIPGGYDKIKDYNL